MLDIPDALGYVFVGRTKETFSTSKIMVGYQGWTNERAAINDAFLPILADGVKWVGNVPSGKLVYSLGFFNDQRSEQESFNRNDNVFSARAVFLPLAGTEDVLHLAVAARYGEADDGMLQYRSKPESYPAQEYAIDTGLFPAHHANMLNFEAYYRPGPLMFGMEYMVNQVSSPESGDPYFYGGEIFAAWTITGETRPYNDRSAYFDRISPNRTVFEGGPGAWELVLRMSYADLDSASIEGGKFWRITPMVNWHLSDNVRLEFVYGYGVLDRFGLEGATHFFQSRIQFQL
jgi:phosphate-selective porin OprO/OprP